MSALLQDGMFISYNPYAGSILNVLPPEVLSPYICPACQRAQRYWVCSLTLNLISSTTVASWSLAEAAVGNDSIVMIPWGLLWF